jgi:hypothetical protein
VIGAGGACWPANDIAGPTNEKRPNWVRPPCEIGNDLAKPKLTARPNTRRACHSLRFLLLLFLLLHRHGWLPFGCVLDQWQVEFELCGQSWAPRAFAPLAMPNVLTRRLRAQLKKRKLSLLFQALTDIQLAINRCSAR